MNASNRGRVERGPGTARVGLDQTHAERQIESLLKDTAEVPKSRNAPPGAEISTQIAGARVVRVVLRRIDRGDRNRALYTGSDFGQDFDVGLPLLKVVAAGHRDEYALANGVSDRVFDRPALADRSVRRSC